MYYLYILLCDKAFFYSGVTNNLNRRIQDHKSSYSPHTKRYKSIELVFTETFSTRNQAEKREKQIKGWSNRKKKALVEGNLTELISFSKSRS